VGYGASAHGWRVKQLLHPVGLDAREHLLDADQHAEHAAELLDHWRCHLHDRPRRNAHAHVLHHRRLHEQYVGDDAYAIEQRVERFHVLGVVGFEQRHADILLGQFILGIDVVQRLVLFRIVVERFIQQRVGFIERLWFLQWFGIVRIGQQRNVERRVVRCKQRDEFRSFIRRIVGRLIRRRIVGWRVFRWRFQRGRFGAGR
jgi:hypothetical protein